MPQAVSGPEKMLSKWLLSRHQQRHLGVGRWLAISHKSFSHLSPAPQKDFAIHGEQTTGQLLSLMQQEWEEGAGCVVPPSLPAPPPIRHTDARAGVLGVST